MFCIPTAQTSAARASNASSTPFVGPKTYLDAARLAPAQPTRLTVIPTTARAMEAPVPQPRLSSPTCEKTSGFPTKEALETAMAKGSTTCKWDMITSYSLDKLNAVLAENHEAGASPKTLSFDLSVGAPALGIPVRTHHVTLNLGCPTLQFYASAQPASCELSLPITSGSIVCEQDAAFSQSIPPNTFIIKIDAPLASVSGSDGKVSDLGTIVTVNGDDDAHKIFLNFTKDNRTTFKVVSGAGEQIPADDVFGKRNQSLLAKALRTYFTETCDGILYELASISRYTGDQGDMVLRPKSFLLATHSEGDDAVLSVYVNVSGTDNPPGDRAPRFKPGGKAMLPIPQGSDASVIFSRDAMSRMLAAAFRFNTKAVKRSSIFIPNEKGSLAGIEVIPKNDKVQLSYQHSSKGGGQWIQKDRVTINPFTVDYNKHPLQLRFDDHKNNTLNLNWSLRQKNVHWRYEHWVFSGKIDNETGDLEFDSSVNKTATLNCSDKKLSLNAGPQRRDYQASFIRGKGEWIDFYCASKSGPSSLLDQLNSKTNSVNLALAMPSIDFTQEKNILLDEKHTLSIDTATGLKVPWDYLLLGNITEKK